MRDPLVGGGRSSPKFVALVFNPRGDVIVPAGMEFIREILFDPAEIEHRLGAMGKDGPSGRGRSDRSVLLVQTDGTVVLIDPGRAGAAGESGGVSGRTGDRVASGGPAALGGRGR